MTIRGLLKTSGLAALATAMAVTALASTPAYAKPGDDRGSHADRGDRGDRGGDRGGRSTSGDRGGDRGDRGGDRSGGDRGRSGGGAPGGRSWSAPAPAPAPVVRSAGGQGDARGWSGGRSGGGQGDRGRTGGWTGGDHRADAGRSGNGGGVIAGLRRDARDHDRNRDRDRDNRDRDGRDWRDGNHNNGSWNGNGNRNGQWNNGNHGRDWNNGNYNRWNRNWHSNNRYDWRGWRNSHRNTFHIGIYSSPYRNYSYRRLNIGFYLDSLFYSNRYWINDPYQYRLPEAYGPYRWVRYYDDALLVNIYTGEVEDVLYDFFW